jgi:hypothetical protein
MKKCVYNVEDVVVFKSWLNSEDPTPMVITEITEHNGRLHVLGFIYSQVSKSYDASFDFPYSKEDEGVLVLGNIYGDIYV